MEENKIAGSGYHSHEVPTVPLHAVLMRDSSHDGTIVVLSQDQYLFIGLDYTTTKKAARCILIQGQNAEELGALASCAAYDLDAPKGLMLVGTTLDDHLTWLSPGATVLWDSHNNCAGV